MLVSKMLHARVLPPNRSILLVLAAAVAAAGCKAPRAFGDRNSLIVHADPALWERIEPDFRDAVERRYHTSRPERIFNMTFIASGDTLWQDLRQWNQVIVLGTREDALIQELADQADGPVSPPEIFQVYNIWANGQTVTALSLPTDGTAEAAVRLLPSLFDRLHEQYVDWVRHRMYASGINDSLASVLLTFGFALQLPRVYDYVRQDSLFRFKSAYPDQASMLRSVLVTWQSGAGVPGPDELRAWRAGIGESVYDPQQRILDEGLRFDTVSVNGWTAAELRGVWQDEGDFPAAGPFIVRAVPCPDQDRTYYMDAWVYAPGKDKYVYVVQLEYMLGTFRCGQDPPISVTADNRNGRFEVRSSNVEVRSSNFELAVPSVR